MEWLNYHHLLYFWMVAREGGLGPAGKILRLSHPTLSGQIKKLEDALGERLFERRGRRLELTEVGRTVFRYADEIFSLGREMQDLLRGRPTGAPARLVVGIVDAVPKMLVRHILEPALRLPEAVQLICHEDRFDRLLADLASHHLDVVIADGPVPSGSSVRAYNHPLGESTLTLLGLPELARSLRRRFPHSVDGAPLLLPLAGSPQRRNLDAWFLANGVRPRVVAEAEDSALLKAFAADGMGLVFAPTAVTDIVARSYGLARVGEVVDVKERFYAISAERRLVHPAVVAIREAARTALFASA